MKKLFILLILLAVSWCAQAQKVLISHATIRMERDVNDQWVEKYREKINTFIIIEKQRIQVTRTALLFTITWTGELINMDQPGIKMLTTVGTTPEGNKVRYILAHDLRRPVLTMSFQMDDVIFIYEIKPQ